MSSGFAKSATLTALLCSGHMAAQAIPIDPHDPLHRVGPADIPCVIKAAMRHDIPANVLLAVASMEGGKNGQQVLNKNGTYDVGHFQINSIHFSENGVFRHIKREDATWRGCYNAELAAWFLKQRLNARSGGDYWTRVATYHSATPKYNAIYRGKLIPLAARWGVWLQANYKTTISYH